MASARLARIWNPISSQRRANAARTLMTSRFITQQASLPSEHGANAPLELDQSMLDLLRDADMSIHRHKTRFIPRQLEVLPGTDEYTHALDDPVEEDIDEQRTGQRKSSEAKFGSQGIGTVVLPPELVNAIEGLIQERDKHTLHNDAKRLFNANDDSSSGSWNTNYETQYKSRKQAARHADRDGTAFASVALPAHFSVVLAVLEHAKHRLGKAWEIDSIMEWGTAVGSGIWASLHSFQQGRNDNSPEQVDVSTLPLSTVRSYLAIDKRVGLTAMAKKLLKDVDIGHTTVRWQKGFSDVDYVHRSEGGTVLALSAFYLSTLPTPLARKAAVKEMWKSGADTIVLIDHDSPTGFESIAEAREYMLRMGRKETEDTSIPVGQVVGCHVVAPCPHDGACPLHHIGVSSSVKCTFSQRIQRPSFLRKTKHVSAGHEDMGYSYVVIRRGNRPSLAVEGNAAGQPVTSPASVVQLRADQTDSAVEADSTPQSELSELDHGEQVRLKSFSWPRLVFPPLKKSGHIILDCCTPEGKIMRMTIPKSQGKQEYYDARKSSWGDIFPHPPKNPPQVRLLSRDGKTAIKGGDIGKRNMRNAHSTSSSYDTLANDINDAKKQRRRRFNQERQMYDGQQIV